MSLLKRMASARPLERTAIAITLVILAIVITPMILSDIESIWDTPSSSPPASSVTPESFRFDNYRGAQGSDLALVLALRKIFPRGTSKTYIDDILVTRNGASVTSGVITLNGKTTPVVTYSKPASILYAPFCQGKLWIVNINYNRSQTLTDLEVLGPCTSFTTPTK